MRCKVDWMQLRYSTRSDQKRKTERRRKETSGRGKVSASLKYAFCRYNNTLVDNIAANFGCYEKIPRFVSLASYNMSCCYRHGLPLFVSYFE